MNLNAPTILQGCQPFRGKSTLIGGGGQSLSVLAANDGYASAVGPARICRVGQVSAKEHRHREPRDGVHMASELIVLFEFSVLLVNAASQGMQHYHYPRTMQFQQPFEKLELSLAEFIQLLCGLVTAGLVLLDGSFLGIFLLVKWVFR